jgi:hypothetical protein
MVNITKKDIQLLKDMIKDESVLTRRTIVKNSQKNDIGTIKRRLNVLEERNKRERKIREKYPAVQEAYNHYKLAMTLVGDKK